MSTALVDLSNVCRRGDGVAWERYLRVRAELHVLGLTVHAIGDNSLRYRFSPVDRSHLEAAVRRGEVELVPDADPHLIRRVVEDVDTLLVSDDRFEPLREQFPELQGLDRVLVAEFAGDRTELRRVSLTPLDREAVVAAERRSLHELGFVAPQDLDLLRFDWRCRTSGCPVAALPQLDELPRCRAGAATCPGCGRLLHRLGAAEGGIELELVVGGQPRQRVAVAQRLSLTVGRGAAPGDIDVQHLLDDVEDAVLVAREHLVVTNLDGLLRVRDAGSRYGTSVVHGDGASEPLLPGHPYVIGPGDRVVLAGILEIRVADRRCRAAVLRSRGELMALAS